MRSNKKGSVHLIGLVLIVIGLLVALGVVYYQNFIVKRTSNTSSAQQPKMPNPTEKDTKKERKFIQLDMTEAFSPGLSLQYPEDWTVHRSTLKEFDGDPGKVSTETYLLTSPDGTTDVKLVQTISGGLGGACNPDELPNILYYSYELSKVWKTKAYADYTTKGYLESDLGKYIAVQEFGNASMATKASSGKSICDLYMFRVNSDLNRFVGSDPLVMVASMQKHGGGSLTFESLEQANTYLSSQTALDVKSILLSIK